MNKPPKDLGPSKKARKATGKPFEPGHEGGPGRPAGMKKLSTEIRELTLSLTDSSDLEAAGRKAIEILTKGMDHIEEKVRFECAKEIAKLAPKFTYLKLDETPKLDTLKDINRLTRSITKDVTKGKIALEKAKAFKELLVHDRDTLRDEISEEILKGLNQ